MFALLAKKIVTTKQSWELKEDGAPEVGELIQVAPLAVNHNRSVCGIELQAEWQRGQVKERGCSALAVK
jgi:hypothetical protein